MGMGQIKREEQNKEAMSRILAMGKEFGAWYKNHTVKETLAYFGITEKKALYRIMAKIGKDALGIDYDKHAESCKRMRGRKSTRTHEDFMRSAALGAKTQRENWARKSEEEKEAWREKMRESHSSEEYKKKRSELSKRQWEHTPKNIQQKLNRKRGIASKLWWASLSEEQKAQELNKRYNNGAGYKTSNSAPNMAFAKRLEENGISFSREFRIDNYSYDFKVGNALIEIDPYPTHNCTWSPFQMHDKDYHMRKSETARAHGFNCIHVFDWDSYDVIVGLLKPRTSMGARTTELKPVDKKEADGFLDKYHTQRSARFSVCLGLYSNGELVSLMAFGKPRYNSHCEWELIRYCSNQNVMGGAEKLFGGFLKAYNPKSVVSYCDKAKFEGLVYPRLHFELKRKGKPSLHWYNPLTKEHYTASLVRQLGFSKLTGIYEGLDTDDNDVLMLEHGFVEVYDCGQDTWEWKA